MRWWFAIAVLGGIGCASFDEAKQVAPADADAGTSPSLADASADASSAGDGGRTSKYAAAVMADAPKAYWRMDDASLSTSGITLVNQVTGAPEGTSESGALTLGAQGALGASDGTALALNAGLYALGDRFDFEGTASFTIELFVRVTDVAFAHVITKQDRNSPKSGYALYVENGQLTFERWVNDKPAKVNVPAAVSQAFVHIAAVYNGTAIRVFVNGASMPDTKAELLLGGSALNGTAIENPLTGVIDELAIYDKVLPTARILAHIQAAQP